MSRTCAALLLTFLACGSLSAQQRDSGVVRFVVAESMGPVTGAIVRAAGRSTRTNAEGVASLTLPVGHHTVSITRIGYTPTSLAVVIVADSVLRMNVEMAMAMAEMEEVK